MVLQHWVWDSELNDKTIILLRCVFWCLQPLVYGAVKMLQTSTERWFIVANWIVVGTLELKSKKCIWLFKKILEKWTFLSNTSFQRDRFRLCCCSITKLITVKTLIFGYILSYLYNYYTMDIFTPYYTLVMPQKP